MKQQESVNCKRDILINLEVNEVGGDGEDPVEVSIEGSGEYKKNVNGPIEEVKRLIENCSKCNGQIKCKRFNLELLSVVR